MRKESLENLKITIHIEGKNDSNTANNRPKELRHRYRCTSFFVFIFLLNKEIIDDKMPGSM